ncbi:MAG: DUF89 family protein [Campylobacterales bacterium]|nr:DUF89 family protein [Campylobacterales bacterium]
MKIDAACVSCIASQSQRVCDAIHASPELRETIALHVGEASQHFDFSLSPPEVATDVYEAMARLAEMDDLYAEQKALSTEHAKPFLPALRTMIAASDDPLYTLLKVAVAGNVIDLAAEVRFDLEEQIAQLLDTPFGIDGTEALREALSKAQTLIYIGDNAGEHLFDYLAIEALQKLYPSLHVSYMVRGRAIINDVTLKEAREAGFESLCTLVDSGVNTPGFAYARATPEAQRLFERADVVLTKGMGNYECLSPAPRGDLCYLLKVKCGVVAASLGRSIGDLICLYVPSMLPEGA